MDSEDADDAEFSKLKDFFDAQSKVHEGFWTSLDTLTESNKFYKSALDEEREQFRQYIENQSSSSTNHLYITLKDDYNNLKLECASLRTELDKAQENSLKAVEELKEQHRIELDELKQDHQIEIASWECKMENLKRENEVNENELSRIQTEAAFNFDEMQTDLQNRLLDLNKKLREANNSNNILRTQMMTFKAHYSDGINSAEKNNFDKIKYLEDKLLVSENQLRIANEKLFDRGTVPKYTKYSMNFRNTTGVDVPVNTETINLNNEVNLKHENADLERAKGFWSNEANKSNVLQVKQVTTVTSTMSVNDTKSGVKKRRKLFNLEDTDYLNNLNYQNE
ncbi:PREDICTED: GRIP and coiled-coil domain-containing protein PFC0235w-like [Nicrophorus vespilloides]|uniref:GRIP and coiled-coil domain-containing protein PFC0235w-like n=1 Tax=Nicrophorus vespilloides TaxID=110193 RepID=A0ABM1M892_NICVS|nr:PREDICTED: GRIP and coiled-coil domain-containing protein PFC0235w-like [Nicrophorus vespilloides]